MVVGPLKDKRESSHLKLKKGQNEVSAHTAKENQQRSDRAPSPRGHLGIQSSKETKHVYFVKHPARISIKGVLFCTDRQG